jgi:predicted ArsR family transcriptional regulator
MDFTAAPASDLELVRFLSHPVRAALLALLRERGQVRATSAAEAVGQTPSNCSFHLRAMEAKGVVRRVTELSGPRRPVWELTGTVLNLATDDDSPARALGDLLALHTDQRAAAWRRNRSQAPASWRQASFEIDVVLALPPHRLRELGARLQQVIDDERASGEQGSAHSRTVQISVRGYPLALDRP